MSAKGRFLLGCGLVPALVLSIGCISLKRNPPQKRQFVLDVTRPADLDFAPEGMILQIPTVRMAHLYEGKGFVYRKSDRTFESDFYNEFFASPEELFTEEIRKWFSGTGLSFRVVDASGRYDATHTLDARVNALYGDYSEKKSHRAILTMEFVLYRNGPSGKDAVFRKQYSSAVPFDDATADALIIGWNAALGDILFDLEGDLEGVNL